jgi:hypothetical protein
MQCTDCKAPIDQQDPSVRLARCCGGLAHAHCVFERLARCEESRLQRYMCARCAARIPTEEWRKTAESRKRARDD